MRPKIGLALSGGSGRAIAHVGVLEVFREHNIPIDIITACSSGTIVAGSFACGTLEELKKDWLSLNKEFIFSLLDFDGSGKGIFGTEKIATWITKYFNGVKNMEALSPRLGFVCVDIASGTPLVLALGNIVRAGRASCAVPGLFEPVEWGNKLLVDGGLFSVVPVQEARDLGADIVIGVDIAVTRQIVSRKYLNVWRGFKYVKDSLPFQILGRTFSLFNRLYEKTAKVVFYNQSDFFEPRLVSEADLFSILGKSMELVTQRQTAGGAQIPTCEVLLMPNVKKLGKMDFGSSKKIYLEGRRAALEAIPQIQSIIKNYKNRDD